jgi:hypothetical protein
MGPGIVGQAPGELAVGCFQRLYQGLALVLADGLSRYGEAEHFVDS